jgi:hypothetical protein
MDLKAWKIWRQGTNAQFLNKGSAASAGDGLDHLSGGGKQLRKLLKPRTTAKIAAFRRAFTMAIKSVNGGPPCNQIEDANTKWTRKSSVVSSHDVQPDRGRVEVLPYHKYRPGPSGPGLSLYARHGQSLGGGSPLEKAVVLTPSRRQRRRGEAGSEGSPRRNSAPRNTNRVSGWATWVSLQRTAKPDTTNGVVR